MTGFTSLIKALKIISIAGEVMVLEVIFRQTCRPEFFLPSRMYLPQGHPIFSPVLPELGFFFAHRFKFLKK